MRKKGFPNHFFYGCAVMALVSLIFFPSASGWGVPHIPLGKIDTAGIRHLIREARASVFVMMASWCAPCRAELPTLVKLSEEYRSTGLSVIGIAFELDGPAAIQELLEKDKVNFPIYWTGDQTLKDLKIRAVPTLLLVKNGKIVEKVLGIRGEAFLRKKFQELLK